MDNETLTEAPAGASPREAMEALFRKLLGGPGEFYQTWKSAFDDAAVPQASHPFHCKGRLILMGGGMSGRFIDNTLLEMRNIDPEATIGDVPVESYDPTGLYRKMVEDFDLRGREIVVISSASEKYNVAGGADMRKIFAQFGVDVHVIDTQDPAQVDTRENLEALARAPLVFMDGGDQKLLAKTFAGTKAASLIKDRLGNDADFVLAGTSAGAMVASDKTMMYPSGCETGLGLLPSGIVVETHCDERGRGERLTKLLAKIEGPALGIALNEGTAVEIRGSHARVYGAGPTMGDHRRGEFPEKTVAIYHKKTGPDGTPVIEAQRHTCNADRCTVLRFTTPVDVASGPVPGMPPMPPVPVNLRMQR